ncbi:MAG: metallophosphoesterase [Spirochaetaceae bacterium]|nr:metallophosphoesterase [Spirochaetaceae bacterium]
MVTFPRRPVKNTVLFSLVFSLIWGACTIDLPGFFASDDFAERLKDRNAFVFLTPQDRNITLGDTYSFVVLTDTHIEGSDAHGLDRLKRVLLPPSDPGGGDKFVVVTGDITQSGYPEEVRTFLEIAKSLGIPCYPVLGNHDTYFGHWPVWRDLIGSSLYRIDADSATLLILDTANAAFGADQLDWIKKELSTAKPRVFAFTHANFFVDDLTDRQQFTDIKERAKAISLFTGRCDVLFSGHVHKRIIRDIAGVRYMSNEDYRSKKTYCRVYVSPGGIRYDFKTL